MRRPRNGSSIRLREKGFSLIEMLIAIFITGIVAVSLYSVYNIFFRQSSTQDMVLEAQQNARVSINLMERELINAGYASATPDIITAANPSEIEFIYTDPATDNNISPTAGKRLKVKYALQTTGGIQYLTRKADNLTDATTGNTEKVVPYVDSLDFGYFKREGETATTTTQNDRNDIKFITVTLQTRTKSNAPGTSSPKTFKVETHIRLRNIGVGQTGLDTSPPSAPTGLQVRDPGVCGRLKVKWTKNTEGDISGYKIYYGTASGNYTGVINVPIAVLAGSTYSCTEAGSTIECSIFPSSPTLSYVASNAAAGTETVYYVAAKAYDNSLNHSSFSGEVSGNPATSNAVFDAGADDSTINPEKPAAVAGFTAADGSGDGQVNLSWTAYDYSTANPGVVGFRVYRSADPFASYPIEPGAGIEWIAGEPGSGKPEISSSAAAYTDPGPGLVGCRKYYYAIAPVNCDPTLITDNGGDPDSKKYLLADYNATCGDGASACSPGSGFASVAGSDTAPRKTTVPSAPTINARAGWKRVALSLTQPADTDLDQTCVYENDSASYPELLTDTASYPKVSKCYQANITVTPDARLVPDSGGIFTSAEVPPAQSTSFWHDSMTVENPGTPSLAETGTYSYRAVSFDLCGNGSAPSAAQATTILCGEDPSTGEKPPAVTAPQFSNCGAPAGLTWTAVSSDTAFPSSPDNPYDLAGYRVFRATSTSFATSTMISGAAPFWGTSYNDTAVTDGGTYYYRVVSTDCPYERVDPSEAVVRTDMVNDVLHSALLGPVKPGRIDRDLKCEDTVGAVDSVCNKANPQHRESLTGVSMNNSSGTGNGSSTPGSSFTHNSITMFFDNTSAGTMTITGATVNWVNSAAFLREIKIGGGRSGVGQTSTNIPQASTVASGTAPYTSMVSNVTLTSAQIPAGARYVPVKFEFKDSGGTSAVDMRDDQLLLTLQVTNDTSGTTACSSYLTISQVQEGIFVPFGPSVSATQQNQPSSPTFSYAVPGSTGLNSVPNGSDGSIVAGSGTTVTVSASVLSNTTDEATGSKIAISTAKLYYKATDKTTTTPPTSGFTEVTMTRSGNIWSGNIPAEDGERVWYYIVATDSDGNWDRDPEIADGAYVYDQDDFDACSVTPNPPTNLTATPSGGSTINLAWSAATTYTNGANINGSDSLVYRISRTPVFGAQPADQAGTTYSNTGLAAGIYSYTVKAKNSCSSSERISTDSNIAASCVGNTAQATLSLDKTSLYRGDSYTVTVVDCYAMRTDIPVTPPTYGTSIQTVNGTDANFNGFTNTSTAPGSYNPSFNETGAATGTFVKTITTTSDTTDSTKLLVLPTDTISVTYPFATPATKTISVIVDPCTTTPKAPTALTGSTSGQNITVSWTGVTQNTDNSAITDLAGYRIYEKVCANGKPNCTGADIVADWFLRTSVTGATTKTVSADQGNLSQRIYYFKVTAYDTCSTPIESAYSNTWNE